MKGHDPITCVQNAIDFIENHIEDDIAIESIAANAYMSTSAFYKVFSAVFDTTVKDYVRKRRLSLSAYDLVFTDMSILQVAIKYHYGSYESYSRGFKKLYGLSPSAYRERAQYIDVFPGVHLFKRNAYKVLEGENMTIEKHMNRDKVDHAIQFVKDGYLLDIDIDRFQDVNDKYGYSVGDKVLVAVPECLEDILKKQNMETEVIRINNDEFAVILKDISKDEVTEIARHMVKSMNAPLEFGDVTVDISISIGIAEFHFESSEQTAVEEANKAMFKAKKAGRNTFEFY